MLANDGNFDRPQPHGPPEITYPIREDPSHFVIKQRMWCPPARYLAPPYDERHPHYPAAYVVSDESFSLQGRFQQFDRRWATVPRKHIQYENRSVAFPALGGLSNGDLYALVDTGARAYHRYDIIPRSSALSLSVIVRRDVEYFLVGANSPYPSPLDVPITPAFRLNDTSGHVVDDLESAAEITFAQYKSWVQRGVELCVSATKVSRYLGNIYRSETEWTRAQ